ncbi:MAG TPA: AzlD domain-containing protein [Euzebyales bacterium]|nr:AzlD domain-containing protein [Euzebyales bacterium]
MNAALALLGAAAGSYVLRIAFVTLIDVERLPDAVKEALRYVGPAVTAAIVVSSLAHGEGRAGLDVSAAQVIGLLAAAVTAWRSGSLLWSLGAGMVSFTLVGLLL